MQKRLGRPAATSRPSETSTIRFWVLIVILVVFGWMGLARLVRGEVKSLREREFVQAARAIGVPTRSILFREILPNLVGPIIVSASIAVPAYITYEATLSLPRRRPGRAHRLLGSHHRRRAEPLRDLPPVALALGHRPVAARPRPEPARRLDPRRVRPQQPPVDPTGSSVTRCSRQSAGTRTKGANNNALDQSPDRGGRGLPRPRRGLRRAGADDGTGTGSNGTSGPRSTGGSAGPRPDAKGPAPEVPGAKKGGILTVSYASTPANMDPSDQFYQDTAVIYSLTHRALTTFVLRDGKQVLVPDLATDLGKASEDGLTWTFTLKDGIKYEDGTPVKAADIVFAAKRSFDPDLAANGPTYQREFFKGGADYQGPYKGDKNWKGVEAPDDKTVVFHLEKRFETLPYFVSFNQFTPIPEAKDTKADYQLHPLATGPYMFDKYTPGTELDAQAQPQLGPRHRPGAPQLPRRLPLQVGRRHRQDADGDPRLQRRRRHDAQLGPDRLLARHADRGREEGPVRGGPVLLRVMVNLDARKIPLPVRKAIAVAYPFDSIHKAAGETTHSFAPGHHAHPAADPRPPRLRGRGRSGVKMNGTGRRRPGRGQEDARRRRLRTDKPFELIYYYTNDDDIAQKVNQVRKQALEKAGFKVHGHRRARQGASQARRRPEGQDQHAPVARAAGASTGRRPTRSSRPPSARIALSQGGTTFGNFSDAKIDAEIKRIQRSSITEQGPEWGKMDKWLTETYLLAIPDNNDKGNSSSAPRCKNVHNNPNNGMPDLDRRLARPVSRHDTLSGGARRQPWWPSSRAPTTGAHPNREGILRAHVHPRRRLSPLSVILVAMVATFVLFFVGPVGPGAVDVPRPALHARAAGRHPAEHELDKPGRRAVPRVLQGPVRRARRSSTAATPSSARRPAWATRSDRREVNERDLLPLPDHVVAGPRGHGRLPDDRRHAGVYARRAAWLRDGPHASSAPRRSSGPSRTTSSRCSFALYPVILWNRPARSTTAMSTERALLGRPGCSRRR